MRNLPNIYCSYSPGVPALDGTPGSLLTVLKQCLVNGTAPAQIDKIDVVNGVASFVYSQTTAVFFNYSFITITGCDEPLLNGTFMVTNHLLNGSQTSFATTAADGSYGGDTLSVSQPPAGWETLFSGTNESVFRSLNKDSMGVCIHIDDTVGTQALVDCYEDMINLTQGYNRLAYEVIQNNANDRKWIKKSSTASTNPIMWWMIADNTNVYLTICQTSTTNKQSIYGFGGGIMYFWGNAISWEDNFKNNFYMYIPRGSSSDIAGVFSAYSPNTNHNGNLQFVNADLLTRSGNAYTYTNGYILTKSSFGTNNWKKFGFIPNTEDCYNRGNGCTTLNPVKLYYPNNVSYANFKSYMYYNNSMYYFGELNDVLWDNSNNTFFYNIGDVRTIQGKQYIFMPTYTFYSSANRYDKNTSYMGYIPFLVGQKWGENAV